MPTVAISESPSGNVVISFIHAGAPPHDFVRSSAIWPALTPRAPPNPRRTADVRKWHLARSGASWHSRLACPYKYSRSARLMRVLYPVGRHVVREGHDIGIEPTGQLLLDRPIEEAALGAGLVEEFGRIRGIDIVIAEVASDFSSARCSHQRHDWPRDDAVALFAHSAITNETKLGAPEISVKFARSTLRLSRGQEPRRGIDLPTALRCGETRMAPARDAAHRQRPQPRAPNLIWLRFVPHRETPP